MYLVERPGFIVSLIFMLLSIGAFALMGKQVEVDAANSGVAIGETNSVAIAEIHHLGCPPCDTCRPERERRLGTTLGQATPPSKVSKDTNDSTKERLIGALRIFGGVLTMATLLLPILNIWSYGNLPDTLRLYSKVTLVCTTFSSYGWLAYSVLQISFKDSEEIKGIDAIIINGFSWGFIGFLVLVVLLFAWETKGVVCLIGLVVHIILSIGILQFPVFRWVKKESKAKLIIGIIAAFLQNLGELAPLIKLVYIWSANAPQGGYPNVPNFKKIIIISRGFDCITQLYWMLYCLFTYEFDEFGISSIACGGFSLISLCAHCAWAIRPLNGLNQVNADDLV